MADLYCYPKNMTSSSERKHHIDEKFESDLIDESFTNRLMVRAAAKNKKFKNVDFRYTIFETCYFRSCVFENCDFTGCRFTGTNAHGTSFENCKFDYAVFERTQIDSSILQTNCPGFENLKLRFARSLRLNYQSLGDSEAVNAAIAIELDASEAHLHKAWKSTESYYRAKYKGVDRVKMFLRWSGFKALDLIWGNGESTWKLARAVGFTLLGMALIHVFFFGNPAQVSEYFIALWKMPQVFLGGLKPSSYPASYLALVFFVRLVAFGFFMSIIIKRFNRR